MLVLLSRLLCQVFDGGHEDARVDFTATREGRRITNTHN
jgi:hypothetical protein